MSFLQKYFITIAVLLLCASSVSIAEVRGKMICDGGAQLTDVASGMSPRARDRFNSDLTEPLNKKYTYSLKIKAVHKAMKRFHTAAGGYTSWEIAKAIVWAADCTGNDFKWFAGVIGNESKYCLSRKGTGGDSGCGQFTSPAIKSLKLQLKLKNRPRGDIDTASPRATVAMRSMVRSCYQNYKGVVDGSEGAGSEALFYKVMNYSRKEIQGVFRKASAMHIDLLASAIYLKFKVSLAGGYIIPGSAPGGIAKYNGGGTRGYLNHVKKHKNYVRVSNRCVEDTYTPNVAKHFCAMDEDPKACLLDFEASQYSNNNKSIAI